MIGNRKYNIKQQDNAKPYIDCLNLPHIRVTGNTLIWVISAPKSKNVNPNNDNNETLNK